MLKTVVIMFVPCSREGSPVRDGVPTSVSSTLPHSLTAEAVKALRVSLGYSGENPLIIFTPIWQGFGGDSGGGNHDDDDAESVTSECSTFSISSEVSVSPYVRYPHPITVSFPRAHQIVHTIIGWFLAVGFVVLRKSERKESPPLLLLAKPLCVLVKSLFLVGC